jgi:hypothetical protein
MIFYFNDDENNKTNLISKIHNSFLLNSSTSFLNNIIYLLVIYLQLFRIYLNIYISL